MKARILMFTLILVLFIPLSLLAAQEMTTEDFPFELNEAIVTAIVTAFGIGMMPILQLVKGLLRKIGYENWSKLARHASMYIASLVVAGGATAYALNSLGQWSIERMIIYTIWAAVEANQGWKILKELIAKLK